MVKKLFLLNLLIFSCLLTLDAQTAAVSKDVAKPDAAELRRQSFEKVWTTINEKHFDPTFGGVDWQKVRETYEPKASAAKSDAELYSVLRQMLGELKLSHFGIFPPDAEMKKAHSASGVTGVELKMLDGQAVISRIQNGSTAEKAGLKTGFIIQKVDGKTVAELLTPLDVSLSKRGLPEAQKRIYRERVLSGLIDGKVATKANIEVLDDKNQARIFDVPRVEHKGEMSLAVGNFPAQEVVFEAKKLENNIGYIRFNIWVIPQMPKIREAIRSMRDASGIVIDLRGNPGGFGGMATGVAGLLVKEQTSLGSMKSRANETKFIVYPQADVYQGKVVLLTDYGSVSTSEIFAAGLQEIGRARVVGERSAGAVLPSIFDTLPTGAIFQYVISDYKSPKNVLLENRGVIPDTEIKLTRGSLLEGRDLQLEEAIKQITKEK
ncbi:MAG TPA: S41 family peptidase [Pyrinomonadaceae bacterium]|nr:S41 family peptidase [Pyrinomonadaceae bacterium]